MKLKKEQLKRIALALSICLLILWGILGTGASIAWFTDTSSEVKNIFHVAEFDLVVSHRLDDGTYKEIDAKTQVFDDEALYEPGYVQIVYLKVENEGTVPFDYKTAVIVNNYTLATNMFGQTFNLQEYLKFGIVTDDTEAGLKQKIADRELAKDNANMPLNTYETEVASLEAEDEIYMALIVRMPEEVGNIANYRGTTVPKVELGLSVSAQQQGKQ